MTNNEKIYIFICLIYTMLIVLGNIIYQKFIVLDMSFYKFELSSGALLYPMTYLITDIITELYNKDKAIYCVKFAICINIFVAVIIKFIDYLPATTWSNINDEVFHKVFGSYNKAFIGSIIACYISQTIDIYLYSWISKLTNGKYLWLRSNCSTCISLFIDTFIVIGTMTIFNILAVNQIWYLVLNSYSWKLFFTLNSTPLFYLSIMLLRYFLK